MTNKIRLITHKNGILEVEPNEIELIIEVFYVNTTQPYSIILLKSRGDEEFDNNRLFEVWETKAEVKNRIRQIQIQKRNLFSIIKVNPNYNYDK